jgi:nickel-dependent lactate racemase
MRVKLEYGRTGLYAELPDERIVRTLHYKDAPPLADPQAALKAVLERPNGTQPLAEIAKGRHDACIAICDITRPVPNEMILRPVLQTLEAAGIAREKITILVATGLHRPNEGDELVEIVGRQIFENYRIENHHGQALEEHTYLGESRRSVPIWIGEGGPQDHDGLDRAALDGGVFRGAEVDLPGAGGAGDGEGMARA